MSTSPQTAPPPVTPSLFTFEGSKIEKARCEEHDYIRPGGSRVSLIQSRRRQRQHQPPSNDVLPNLFKSSVVMTVNLRKYVFDQSEPQEPFLGNLLSKLPTALSFTDST
jgi:hypothetical protein